MCCAEPGVVCRRSGGGRIVRLAPQLSTPCDSSMLDSVPPCALQYSMYHALGYVYGRSTLCVWRSVGWGLATLAPAVTFVLKVIVD